MVSANECSYLHNHIFSLSGERTKLSFCVSCCTSNYCNYGNAAVGVFGFGFPLVAMTMAVFSSLLINGLITGGLLRH